VISTKFGVENRNILEYNLGKTNNLAFGARLYKANTTRQQQGRGTTGNDFDRIEGDILGI
jgi:Fe(3+) dicitrate transport protein